MQEQYGNSVKKNELAMKQPHGEGMITHSIPMETLRNSPEKKKRKSMIELE